MPNPYAEQYREQLVEMTVKKSCHRGAFWWNKWFSICPLNEVAPLFGITRETSPAYQLLSLFHCWDYSEIPREVRERLPELIREALDPRHQSV